MILNRKDLAMLLKERTGIRREKAMEIVNTFLDIIKEEVKKGNKIELRKFGTFYLKEKKYVKPNRERGKIKTIGFKSRLRF